MDGKSILAMRIAHQALDQRLNTAADVLMHMGAMQAQDYYGALWSVGRRTGQEQAAVLAALERREIIRTWPQRGTLHWVLPQDARWMASLSAPRLIKGATRRREGLGLDEKTLERSKELFAQALEGGVSLTRPQMMELLEGHGISTKAGRGYHILWYAAQTGQIYIGPMKGKQQTFGLLDDLHVGQRQLARDEAAAELALRYFTSHGPATLQDFVWWSGLTVSEAGAALAGNAGKLQDISYEGRQYWLSQASHESPPVPPVMLLAGFDEYLLGYKDRSLQLSAEHALRIIPGNNGMFMPTVVIDGKVAGIWKRAIKPGTASKPPRLIMEIDYFDQASPEAVGQVEAAAGRYAEFLGLTLELR